MLLIFRFLENSITHLGLTISVDGEIDRLKSPGFEVATEDGLVL